MTTKTKPDYKEFTDTKMVSLYDLHNPHFPEERKFYFDLAEEFNIKKILDIGCGTGLLTIPLANAGYNIIGIDPFQTMIDIAKQKAGSDKVHWIVGDALNLKNERVELALMTVHVVQHLIDDDYFRNSLKSIYNSLETGGYLVFDTRNTDTSKAGLNWPKKDNPKESINPAHGKILTWVNILNIVGNIMLYEVNNKIVSTGEVLTSTNELVFRKQDEITKFLNEAGFEIQDIYGNFDKSELTVSSPEIIFVCKKLS
jgi:2-polyprenyl-3-methyl-5-hydroxy-6-metoxy-1,4-benzoquinol methylase